MGDVLDKVGARLIREIDMFGVFREDKGRDVVVPDDLHLVKPAVIDSDGNVDCIYCRGKVAHAKANLIGSDGYACPRCLAAIPPPVVELPADVRIKRGPVPYLIAFGVVALFVTIVIVAMQ